MSHQLFSHLPLFRASFETQCRTSPPRHSFLTKPGSHVGTITFCVSSYALASHLPLFLPSNLPAVPHRLGSFQPATCNISTWNQCSSCRFAPRLSFSGNLLTSLPVIRLYCFDHRLYFVPGMPEVLTKPLNPGFFLCRRAFEDIK